MKIKKYKKIVSLDFELYNSMHYWSICWCGVFITTTKFSFINAFDIKVNPDIRHKFCGKEIVFPFSLKEIQKEKFFSEVAKRLLVYLNPTTLVLGHAVENDIRMLIDVCAKYNITCPEFDFIDTNTLYNAISGEKGERGLARLAEKYGIVFNNHDPLEDARATSLIAKHIIKSKDISEFLEQFEIKPSKLKSNLIFRGGLPIESKEQLKKLNLYNQLFVYGCEVKKPLETYYFDPSVLSKNDLTPLLEALSKKNHSFTATPYSANITVTNNLMLLEKPNVVSLRTLVHELLLDSERFDFSPKRIRDEKFKAITCSEYYAKKYKQICKDGILGGRKVSFSKRVEKNSCFEKMIMAICNCGGSVSFEIKESDIFIIANKDELKMQGDSRLRAYRRDKKQRVFTLEEFNDYLQNSVQ